MKSCKAAKLSLKCWEATGKSTLAGRALSDASGNLPQQEFFQEEDEGVLEVVLVGAFGEAVAFVFGDQVPDRAVLGADFVAHLGGLAGGDARVVQALGDEER